MNQTRKVKVALIAGAALVAVSQSPAMAHHWWGGYAWDTGGTGIVDVPVIDNTSSQWSAHVQEAVMDWNVSPVISATLQYGNNSSCSMVTGTIQVCNDDYGANGWLGLATIALSSGAIVAGSTKLNDNYFNRDAYNNYTRRQLVTCQEIGHDFGLAHQNEDFSTDETTSCMEYTSNPADNEHPDFHDYDQLLTMYSGGGGDGGGDTGDGGGDGDGGKGKGGGNGGGKPDGKGGGKGKNKVVLPAVGNTPASWGRPVDYLPNGKPFKFERFSNGIKFVTHVSWAPDEDPGHGDHH